MMRSLITPLLTLGVVLTLALWLTLKSLVAGDLPVRPLPDLARNSCTWPSTPLLGQLD